MPTPASRSVSAAFAAAFAASIALAASVALAAPQESPAALRAARAATVAAASARPFEVARHRIEARVEPAERSLDLLDEIEVVARVDGLAQVRLYTSVIAVDDVTCDRPIEWSCEASPNADVLTVTFGAPLAAGERVTLLVHAFAADYFLGTDQQLIAEIAVLGQVRPRSSWSSHVLWYPFDEGHDAAMEITFDVPAGYVAVTGGRRVLHEEADGRVRFRYVEETRHARLLPFGFAVAQYVTAEAMSPAGLDLEVFAWPGEEARIAQRIELLQKGAAQFERALGPLPWSAVRFCHVTPDKKETGVSLPGQILVSDFYFPDLAGVDASDGNLERPDVLGLLVVADELSHQWNIYAAGFPNELGEGLSTWTNAFFIEALHGAAAYQKVLAGCKRGWIGVPMRGAAERAIADPAVYATARYRSIVFCKTPLVLHLLREQLGDERFFAGLADAFARRDRATDGFERFAAGFSAGAGVDLAPFFEQWFFRAGWPKVALAMHPIPGGAAVTSRQLHDGADYDFELPLEFRGDGDAVHRTRIRVNRREQVFDVAVPFVPKSLQGDPDDACPVEIAR